MRLQSDAPRVLIIESDHVLRTMLFTVLQHEPLAVDTARDAEEALEKTRSCDYALIIVDFDSLEDDAMRFLTQFKEERPGATTCVLAVRHPDDTQQLHPDMVSASMTKPLEIDTLAEVVRECAQAVPKPEEPLDCPPSENDMRTRLSLSLLSN